MGRIVEAEQEAVAVFGPVLTQVYGSCEAPHPVTVLAKSDHVTDGPGLGTAGHEVTGVEVRIATANGDTTAYLLQCPEAGKEKEKVEEKD